MDEREVKLAVGSLLHDIGKVLYRYNDGRNHSRSGYDFLKGNGIEDREILDQVRYHHHKNLSGADIPVDSLAYITYWADNVAAGSDRKDREESEGGPRFDKFVPLAGIFNILNGNNGRMTYELTALDEDGSFNMPSDTPKKVNNSVYGELVGNIRRGLIGIDMSDKYVNSLLSVLEANLTFVPSSTDINQINDISLYDHMKITAAVAGCTYLWLKEKQITDYREKLMKHGQETYDEEVFLMYGLDTSGIQNYIYKVASDDVLKLLRAKSFYLEMLLQDITDELLERIGLSRANLIYSGGGHAYILLPNTRECKTVLKSFESELKTWMLENFSTDLYVAHGYAECSGNDLMNKSKNNQEESYPRIFKTLSREISSNKTCRYSAADIIKLNSRIPEQNERECKVCGTTDHLTGEGDGCVCELCGSLIRMSSDILHQDFITVVSAKPETDAVKLPFGRYMLMESEEKLKDRIQSDEHYIRSYSKNKMFTGDGMVTRIWTGDYNNGDTFHDLAAASNGVKKLGVLRADVDNLGQAIISGFDRGNGKNLGSLTRNACLSRKLSVFFKLHINRILGRGEYHLSDDEEGDAERNALIVYSGGDDMFIVGAWNDVLEAAVDISQKFKEFTQGTLTLSGGFSIFDAKFPVRPMAEDAGELEDCAKDIEGKNSIDLFEKNKHRYKWDEFTEKVIGEKFETIRSYLDERPDKGMSAVYKLMSYVRELEESGDPINLARFAYMLGRMEPDRNSIEKDPGCLTRYQEFSRKMYKWIKADGPGDDRRELLTAIYIYVYLNRKVEGDDNYEQ